MSIRTASWCLSPGIGKFLTSEGRLVVKNIKCVFESGGEMNDLFAAYITKGAQATLIDTLVLMFFSQFISGSLISLTIHIMLSL